jgi:DNA-binding response OmpR family regulator
VIHDACDRRPPSEPGLRDQAVRVLITDDDPAMRAAIAAVLTHVGMSVRQASSGAEALERALDSSLDVMLLDLTMSPMTGAEVLRELRRTSDLPVIVVSGVTDLDERIAALALGADDVVTKPFHPAELVARIESVVRRTQARRHAASVSIGDVHIDLESRDATVDGNDVALTAMEFDLLAFLASNPDRTFSRDQLLRQVWDSRSDWQGPATVTEHVRRLRGKIEKDPTAPRRLLTVRSVGYRFTTAA